MADFATLTRQDGEAKLFRHNVAKIMLLVQFRMARAALGWGLRECAQRANLSTNTLVRFERGEGLKQSTIEHLQSVLETAGIEFIPENGGGAGVRLLRPKE
jgi:transcriptional regulator with XRE-family HTH domain